MEWVPLNFDLLKHPVNWIIVTLMVLIALYALDIVSGLFSKDTQ